MALDDSASVFSAGSDLGSTEWLTLPQSMLTEFEVLTKSNDPLHMDDEWVRQHTDFSSTIVPGFLTLSLLPWFFSELRVTPEGFHALNYGLDRVRWISPVPVDSRVKANFVSAGVRERSGDQSGYVVGFDVTVEAHGQASPAMLARWLGAMIPDSQA